jgi:hypothetical protein
MSKINYLYKNTESNLCIPYDTKTNEIINYIVNSGVIKNFSLILYNHHIDLQTKEIKDNNNINYKLIEEKIEKIEKLEYYVATQEDLYYYALIC